MRRDLDFPLVLFLLVHLSHPLHVLVVEVVVIVVVDVVANWLALLLHLDVEVNGFVDQRQSAINERVSWGPLAPRGERENDKSNVFFKKKIGISIKMLNTYRLLITTFQSPASPGRTK